MTTRDSLVLDQGTGMPMPEVSLAGLVAKVFDAAPIDEKARLLEPLLRPLRLMSLFGIADGVFARARLHARGPELHIRSEDLGAIRGADVSTLFAFAEQVSTDVLADLASVLSASTISSGSPAAAVLEALLAARPLARATAPAPTR